MATYDITAATFNINNVIDGDTLNCPYTGSEISLTLPPGTYDLTLKGASGNWAGTTTTSTTTYKYVGGGGSTSGRIILEDQTTLYLNVGGCGSSYTGTSSSTRNGGYNGGGSARYFGGVGGGATSISTKSGLLSTLANYTPTIIAVAGGGGGGCYYRSGNTNRYGRGGSGGGLNGAAGTSNTTASTQYCGQGGSQTAGGAGATYSSYPGQAGSFGQGGNITTGATNACGSAGGGGYYGGGSAARYRASGGGGGSGYISSTWLTNATTTQGTTTTTYTNGSASIDVVEMIVGEIYNVNLSLSGGNFIDGHQRGTYQIREGRSDSFQFIPLDVNDPVKVFVNDIDCSNQLTTQTIQNSISINSRTGSTYTFNLDGSDNYYKSNNKGVANSAANCRVNLSCIQQSTVRFTVVSYTEEDYDIGVIGKLDTELALDYDKDMVGFWNSMGHNSQSAQTVDIPCPPGEHFIDVKYGKDPATDAGNDAFYFKVEILPLTSDTNFIYTFNLNDVHEDKTIRILIGDVTKNLSVLSSGEHVYLNPSGEASVYKGDDYELQITLEDEDEYYIQQVTDNNVNVTSQLVAPHMRSEGTYTVENYTGATYGFQLASGYYASQNTSSNSAALCKVVFETAVPSQVTLTYQSTYSGSNLAIRFGVISEVNGALRTDSGIDTQGFIWNQYDSKTSVTTDTDISFEIPAGTSYVAIKYGNATSSSISTGGMKFKVKSIEALEDLYIPYYTYNLSNVQTAHNIIVVAKAYPKYKVTVSGSGFGAISCEGVNEVRQGNNLTITGDPNTNYIVDQIFVNSQPVTVVNNSYTLTNVQNDANVYVLFSTGNVRFYQKENGAWRQVVQAYRKVNGDWEEIQFAIVGDPNAKYIRKN